jgi:DNA-binding Lrp family transcriptional regulator
MKILKYMSEGLYCARVYNDLAKRCGVGRITVYRRIAKLEEEGLKREGLWLFQTSVKSVFQQWL